MDVNKLAVLHSTIERIKKDKFIYPRFFSNDSFTTWLLIDSTKFCISRIRDAELSKLKITSEKSAVIQVLIRYGGKATIREISFRLMRRKHSVSTLIRRMEKQGLVSIIKIPRHRELSVVVEEKGKELYNKISINSIENIFSVLTSEERGQLSLYLLQLLDKARSVLKSVE